MDLERLKLKLDMDDQMKMNKKNNYIQDSRAYFNEQFNKKKEMDNNNFNEKFVKNNTTLPIKDEERREEFRKKLLRMNDDMEKNTDSLLEYNSRDVFRNRDGKEVMKNESMSNFFLFYFL